MESYSAVYPENNQLRIQEAKLPSNPAATGVRPKAKSSGIIYWFLGASVALVLLIGGFFIAAAAAGLYFYKSRTSVVYAEKFPKPAEKPNPPANKTPVTTEPKTNSGVITNDSIKVYFWTRKYVGRFSLLQVFEKRSTGYFLNADGEASAFYGVRGKREDVMIHMATYTSKETAKTEFIETFKKEKKAGARVIGDVYENEKEISASYQRGVAYVLTFCSFRTPTTSCYRILSPNKTALLDFDEEFFKQ